MAILQVCAFAAPTPGNFIPAILEIQNKMKDKGIDTIYAFPERAKDKPWCIDLQKTNKVYFLPEANARIKLLTYKIFKQIYKENKVEIIHSHFELYDIPATILASKGTKVFWHLHDALKENYDKSGLLHKILTKLQYGVFSKKATLLSVSQEHAKFATELGFNKEKVEYVPNGINISRIKTDVIDNSRVKNQLLLFGWDVYRKGVNLIVEAVKDIKDDTLIIKIIGQKVCKEFLETHKNEGSNHIVYSKPVDDINALYAESLAFLHISRAEGLSYALLEVIYAGLPVICSDIPENRFAE